MRCSIGIIINDGQPSLRLRVGDQGQIPSECPNCHRLFPLAKGDRVKRWIEFSCTRQDEHPREGAHWWENGGAKVTWTVKPGGVWMAGSQERRT